MPNEEVLNAVSFVTMLNSPTPSRLFFVVLYPTAASVCRSAKTQWILLPSLCILTALHKGHVHFRTPNTVGQLPKTQQHLFRNYFVFKTLVDFCFPSNGWHRCTCVAEQQRAAAYPAPRKAHAPWHLSL